MGIIQRQTIKNNILAYLSVAIAAYAYIEVYPQDMALRGHADGLLKWALLIYPFITLGMSLVIVRFFPYLKGAPEEKAGQLLTRGLAVVSAAILGLSAVNWLIGDWLAHTLLDQGYELGKLAEYRWTIIALVAILAYSAVVTAHLANFKRIAVPVIFNNLLLKIGLLGIFLLALRGFYGLDGFTLALVGLYTVAFVGLLFYAASVAGVRPRWGKLSFHEKGLEDMYSLAAFGIFGSIGTVLLTHMDTIFVNTYIGDVDTGVYSFAVFVTMIIAIPFKAVNKIASPIVAERWKAQDYPHLGFLYQQTAQVLFAAGGLIYTGALVCLPYVFELRESTSALAPSYIAVVILGAAQLVDQMTSINGTLVSYTDYYRWNIVFLVIVGILNGVLNYLFIVQLEYGLLGAASATLVSLVLFNSIKLIFIFWKMGLHPLSWSPLVTSLVLAALGAAAFYLPGPENPLLNILLRGGFLTGSYFLYLRYTNGVPPLKRALRGGIKQMLG